MMTPQRLDAVCELTMGQAPDGESYNNDGVGLPLIAGAGDFGELHPVAKKFTTAPGKVCCPGDIVLGIRATIGEKVVADREYCLGRGVAGLRARTGLESRYLWHWLTQVASTLSSKAKGATFKQVNREDIGELAIGLPPAHEQRRIADVLDRAEALRAKRRAALAQLDTLSRSIFLDLFGDPARNPKQWPRKPIGRIAQVITGNTPSRAKPEYFGSAIEWIKSDNINTPHYYLTRADEGLSEVGRAVARIAPAQSILVTCIAGSPHCIGNAAMTDREVAFNQQINALVPQHCDPHFLYAQVLVGKRLIQEASTAGMKGMVSKSRLESIELMFPPFALQHDFARCVSAIERLKSAHRASLAQLDVLFASLQHRAFRGEL
jgi:type I restriction enzyme S subunit